MIFLFLLLGRAEAAKAEAAPADPDQAETYRSPSEGILSMLIDSGNLSLEARDAPLDRVLQELSRLGNLNIFSDGPLEGRVTVKMETLPLDTAVRKILRGKDMTFLYAVSQKGRDSAKEYLLREVRIFVPEGKEGSGRAFSYSRPSPPRPPEQTRPPLRIRPAPEERAERTPPPTVPMPDLASQEEARRLISGLMEGNVDQLDEVLERLKQDNPQAGEQIDQFLESLEGAREKAREADRPFPSVENLSELGLLLQQMMQGRDAPSDR